MIYKVLLGAILAVVAWFLGCIAVMWHKYHKVKKFLNWKSMCKKNKMLALILFLILGIGVSAIFSIYGWTYTKCIRYLILLFGVLILAYIDSKSQIIPNKILIIMFAIRCLLLIVELILYRYAAIELLSSAFGGLVIGFVVFILAYYVSKKGMGMGDVKLISVIGFYTGTAVLYAIIVFSLIACIVYSLVQMARKKVTAKSFVAFGPFVAIGTIVAIVLGF